MPARNAFLGMISLLFGFLYYVLASIAHAKCEDTSRVCWNSSHSRLVLLIALASRLVRPTSAVVESDQPAYGCRAMGFPTLFIVRSRSINRVNPRCDGDLNITLHLEADVEARLTERASRLGKPLAAAAVKVIAEALSASAAPREISKEPWQREFNDLLTSRPSAVHFVDDCREGIYEGCGE